MMFIILGSGQDAGVPQLGCLCSVCARARLSPEYRRLAPSAAVFDERDNSYFLIDASPDIKQQVELLHSIAVDLGYKGVPVLEGIMITHAHPGHCLGLWELGKEAMNTSALPVHCTSAMGEFLRENHPFSSLVKGGNIRIVEVVPGQEFDVCGIGCSALEVPHRNEAADTVGYVLRANKRILYLPDLDRWTNRVLDMLRSVDVAFLDGTFYSKTELPRFTEVPHPPIKQTMKVSGEFDTRIIFTHINHTNPVNLDGPERMEVEEEGFEIARDGFFIAMK